MSVEKLNTHYSMVNPMSVYDEEALTALELAARTTGKVNECVDAVNGIPGAVDSAINKHINDGEFDEQISKYAGDLEQRVNALLNSVEPGSTTRDMEVIDGRTGEGGKVYANLGEHIRDITGKTAAQTAQRVYNLTLDFDLPNHKIKLKKVSEGVRSIIWGETRHENFTADSAINLEIDTSKLTESSTYNVVYNTGSNDLRIVNISDYADNYKLYDVIMATFYGTGERIDSFVFVPDYVTLNGEEVSAYTQPAVAIGCRFDTRFEIDPDAKTITHVSGMVTFDCNTSFVTATSGKNQASYADYNGVTLRLIYNANRQLTLTPLDAVSKSDHLIATIWISNNQIRSLRAHDTIERCFYIRGARWYNERRNDYLSARIFMSVNCIGDSYTSGWIRGSDNVAVTNNPDFNWPSYASRITGAPWNCAGISGSTANSWMDGQGAANHANMAPAQAYFVMLGINDKNLNVTPGTTASANTGDGSYFDGLCRIVKHCRQHNPNAHIFLATVPPKYGVDETYNNVVRAVVSYFNLSTVHCVDLAAAPFWFYDDVTNVDNVSGHYTAIGYNLLAENIVRAMSDYINDNAEKFRDVFKIPYGSPADM